MSKLYVVPEPAEPAAIADATTGDAAASEVASTQPTFDERFSMRVGRRRYYINVRIGAEMRSDERRTAEGQIRVSGIAFIYCVICSAAIMLFGTLCMLYLIKSGIGINLTDDHSILHPLFAGVSGS